MRRSTLLLAATFAVAATSVADAQERRVVKDPGGLPSWTADLRAGSGGRDCAVVRRGRLPKGSYCAQLSSRRVFSYNERRETGTDKSRWRTVFIITFARSVVSARLTTPDGVRTYRRGRGPRVLLAVLEGNVEKSPLSVTATVGGENRTITSGPRPTPTVDDPAGGAQWRLAPDEDAAGAARACVAWERVRPRFSETTGDGPSGRPRCGDADETLPVTFAERVDGRLVITGVTGDNVRSVLLRANDGTRPVAHDRGSGEFLAVLTGDVDPAALTVVATLRSGETVTQALRTSEG